MEAPNMGKFAKSIASSGLLVALLPVFGAASLDTNPTSIVQLNGAYFVGDKLLAAFDKSVEPHRKRTQTIVFDRNMVGTVFDYDNSFRSSPDGATVVVSNENGRATREKIEKREALWYDADNEWGIKQQILLFGSRPVDFYTIGDVRPEHVRYRACHSGTQDCVVTPSLPCDRRTVWWATPLAMGVPNSDLAVIVLCTDWPVDGPSSALVYVIKPNESAWTRISEFSETKADMRSLLANIFVGPPTADRAAFSLIKPIPNGYKLENFSQNYLSVDKKELPPIDRRSIYLAIESYRGYSNLALLIDGGLASMPRGGLLLSVSSRKDLAYIIVDSLGEQKLCVKFQGMPENCSSERFTFRQSSELKHLSTGEGELQYLYVPAKRPNGKLIINVMGGPIYSAEQLGPWSLKDLGELGYDVAIPLLTAGQSRWAHVPAIDAVNLDPKAGAQEVQRLTVELAKSRAVRPILMSGSAGAAIVSYLDLSLFSGLVLVSGDCFPLQTLATGQEHLLSGIMTRERILSDGGVALRLLDGRLNACDSLVQSNSPFFGFWFENDRTLGAISASQSAMLFNDKPNARVRILKGSSHGLEGLGPRSKTELQRALDFVQSRNVISGKKQ
jgi:hypothetical protein